MTAYATIDGRRLEVLDLAGDPALPPLIFLHEGLGSVRLWRAFPTLVHEQTGARTVVFSRFGHGRSDPPPRRRTPTFMHEEANDVLPALFDALEVEQPILVGHSDGGSIALIHAAKHAVDALVLIAPHVFVEQICINSIEQINHTFWHDGLREKMARHHDDPEVTFRGWCDVWLDPLFPHWNLVPLLPAVTAPALLIQGTDDEYGTLDQIETIERSISGPTERLVVTGAGHSPHLDEPELVLAATVRFIERITRDADRQSIASGS